VGVGAGVRVSVGVGGQAGGCVGACNMCVCVLCVCVCVCVLCTFVCMMGGTVRVFHVHVFVLWVLCGWFVDIVFAHGYARACVCVVGGLWVLCLRTHMRVRVHVLFRSVENTRTYVRIHC